MKVISSGSNYQIYPDGIETGDNLPSGTYKVAFSKLSGFSLNRMDDFENIEDKIYGSHFDKINKVMKSFEAFDRSLGVILSGDKGIGKSLFIQLLSVESIKRGIPVIIVDAPYPGVEDFIDSIDQESLILFDEFEKVFKSHDGHNPQDALLSLFDGLSQRKRIYAITVNNLHQVNDFMINRPGRFHYHIRFDYPSSEEIFTYLTDKIPADKHSEIDEVIKFSTKSKLNYDCLRAIAFELTMGETFESAIADLNIINSDAIYYNFTVKLKNGDTIKLNDNFDFFSTSEHRINSHYKGEWVEFKFTGAKAKTQADGSILINGSDITVISDSDDVEVISLVAVQERQNLYSFKAL